jgi:hypothetical protein
VDYFGNKKINYTDSTIEITEAIPYCATLIGLSMVYAKPITGM